MEILTDKYPEELPNDYSKYTSHSLSDFQKWAFYSFDQNKNILISAHTGSGKTLPAEYAIQRTLEKSKKIIYTSPIKALTNQKFYEFKNKYPDWDVGILTGDIKYNPTGNILLMTTEILLNLIYKGKIEDPRIGHHISFDLLNDFPLVIFDEIHYINDIDRGHVWEQCIILLPLNIQLLMLSATLGNPEEFTNWISNIRKRTTCLIPTFHRVVPLYHCIFTSFNSQIEKLELPRSELENIHNISNKLIVFSSPDNPFNNTIYNKVSEYTKKYSRYMSERGILNQTANFLNNNNMLPAIFFTFSRNKCLEYSNLLETDFLTSTETVEVDYAIDYYLRKLPEHEHYKTLEQFYSIKNLLKKGIAYHHSGLIPIFKELIELLYSKGLVKVLFATETFAVGVNMPTKTTVFSSLEKFSDGHQRF